LLIESIPYGLKLQIVLYAKNYAVAAPLNSFFKASLKIYSEDIAGSSFVTYPNHFKKKIQ
jgi:hypothetical protein